MDKIIRDNLKNTIVNISVCVIAALMHAVLLYYGLE